ncbi:hypothetical protein PV04_00381 [Phialophora macrospora]|uniref:Uncharacterized protein n=1 Tax=Phialophora macrospora TaxID=1851006 RepID=A0A0D2ED01_9EURO|nr:hypothetical protein PV04_00381 [Phialophora macrospora]
MDSDSTDVEEAEQIASSLSPDRILPSSPPHVIQSNVQGVTTSPGAISTSPRIVPSLISKNPHAQGEDRETYFRRPNRYFGPASTWLSWTKEERTTALSLDRVRSQDLTTHLFNAFGLKRKAHALDGREPKRRRKGKERASSAAAATGAGDDTDAGSQLQSTDSKFGLSKSWTAWPMPPDQVPREELLPQLHHDGIRRAQADLRPSASLEEWLIAAATRLARGRWDAREWETGYKPTPLDVEQDDGSAETAETLEHGQAEASPDFGDGDVPPSAQPGDDPIFYSQPLAFDDDDDNDDDDNIRDQFTNINDEQSDDDANKPDRRPVPLADNDKARQYFLPSARHIISKLDDLLLGLHKARYAYASKPQGRARGRYSHSQTPEESQTRGRSSSRAASRRRIRSSSANTDVSGFSNVSAAQGKLSRRIESLGLRDWSDIMGMASLTGWDQAIVTQASERCAKLFRENMLFRTFHEGQDRDGTQSYFTETLADQTEDVTPPMDGEETASQTDQHEVQVVRTSRPCTACQASRSQCQPADDRPGASRPCKSCLDNDTACSGIRASTTERARVCPHRSCPRHTIPFGKQYHLQRHLDSMHTGVRTARSMSRSGARAASALSSGVYTDSDPDADVSSGSDLHDSAKIVCPIEGCPRTIHPFSRGKKLYEHVRRMHPEADVNEVKRREARKRSARRGGSQNERRHRSKSREKRRKTEVDEEVEAEDEDEHEEEV